MDNKEKEERDIQQELFIDDLLKNRVNIGDVSSSEGRIIVFEGLDFSFKETNTTALYTYLDKKGYKVKLLSFPNYKSDSSLFVKKYLDGEYGKPSEVDPMISSVLYSVDRFDTIISMDIKKLYDEGYIIIMDRYVGSNLIFQSCKISDGEDKDIFIEKVADIDYNIMKLPREDITIYMNMPLSVSYPMMQRRALKNGQSTDGHERDRVFMQKVEDSALYIANKLNWNIVNCIDDNDGIKDEYRLFLEILNVLNY